MSSNKIKRKDMLISRLIQSSFNYKINSTENIYLGNETTFFGNETTFKKNETTFFRKQNGFL